MSFGWLLLSVGALVEATEFQIDTDTPDALCPELSMTRDAVKKRLGELVVEGGGTWRGRYSTVHDPTAHRGSYVRLVIVDPTGREQARRELPMQGESCATMAQAIALVVDGFFRDLGQLPARETTPTHPIRDDSKAGPKPAADATATTTPKPKTETPGQAQVLASPPASGGRVGLMVGGAYESMPSCPAAVFGLYVAATPRWRFELRSTFPTARVSESFGVATSHLYPIPVRLTLSYVTPSSHGLSWFVGPEGLFSFEQGSTQGAPRGHIGWRTSFGIGARTGVAFWLLPWLAIVGNVSGDAVLFQSRRFLMVDEPTLEVARTRLAGSLELWGVIFQ